MDAVVAAWNQYDRWDLVAVSLVFHVGVLGLFLATAALPRYKLASLPNGMLVAFLVALFAEMYGLPLTVYLLGPLLPGGDLFYPVPLAMRLSGAVLMFAGFMLVFLGWRLVFRSEGRLVTTGIYAHIRHPQYVGLAILTLGQFVEWPTLIGLILWPFLVLLYAHLSRKEDEDLRNQFGKAAARYQAGVPSFIPRVRGHVHQASEHRMRKESMGS